MLNTPFKGGLAASRGTFRCFGACDLEDRNITQQSHRRLIIPECESVGNEKVRSVSRGAAVRSVSPHSNACICLPPHLSTLPSNRYNVSASLNCSKKNFFLFGLGSVWVCARGDKYVPAEDSVRQVRLCRQLQTCCCVEQNYWCTKTRVRFSPMYLFYCPRQATLKSRPQQAIMYVRSSCVFSLRYEYA